MAKNSVSLLKQRHLLPIAITQKMHRNSQKLHHKRFWVGAINILFLWNLGVTTGRDCLGFKSVGLEIESILVEEKEFCKNGKDKKRGRKPYS